MKRSTKFARAAVASLALAAVAIPAMAQDAAIHHGDKPAGRAALPSDQMGMMEGMMGMMMGGMMANAMAGFDTNADASLSPEEMTAALQAELKTNDTDANGTLSLDEFSILHAAHMRQMTVRAFQMHDADGDAQVTEAELAAMAAMMQSQVTGPLQGMPGAGQGMMNDN